MSGIGYRIAAARAALGYANPREVKRDGAPFSVQSLYNYEAGRAVASDYLEWLAARGVSPDYLLLGLEPVLRKDLDAARTRYQIIASVAAGAPAGDVRAMLDLIAGWEGEGAPTSGRPENGVDDTG